MPDGIQNRIASLTLYAGRQVMQLLNVLEAMRLRIELAVDFYHVTIRVEVKAV